MKHCVLLCPSGVCPLTLDTNTTCPRLSLSENNSKVTRTSELQPYPDHPDRFTNVPQVLCREAQTGGAYWKVEWSGAVRLAMTYRGITRRGVGDDCVLGDNDKSWCLDCDGPDNRYSVLHNKKRTVLHVRPSGCYTVAVYVDFPAGLLSFYRVSASDAHTHLHTFTTRFTEPLYAGFSVWPDSSVSLCQTE